MLHGYVVIKYQSKFKPVDLKNALGKKMSVSIEMKNVPRIKYMNKQKQRDRTKINNQVTRLTYFSEKFAQTKIPTRGK